MKHPRRHIRPFASLSLAGSLVLLGLASSPSDSLPNNIGEQTPPSLTAQPRIVESYGKLPLSFEANLGQTSSPVKFLSRGQGYTLFLTRRAEAVLVLGKSAPKRTPAQPADKLSAVVQPQPAAPPAVLRMKLVGAKRTPQVEGLGEFPGKANYFIGNDPKKWRTNVPTYAKVRYREVYPGVDLMYYGNQRQLEHDFIVAPGADARAITLSLEGAGKVSIGSNGDLALHTDAGEVRLQKPVAYQEVAGARREISASYRLKGAHQVGFQVDAYEADRPLIIDPALAYSTYLGGSFDDIGNGIAVDSSGNAYVTGYTYSTNFPGASSSMIQGSHDPGYNSDAFVAEINAAGTALLYSTYLGGNGRDIGNGIAVDSSRNAYVTGYTSSTNFPGASSSSIQPNYGGGFSDGFVAKINAAGTALLYSTYLGGSFDDFANGIAVDSSRNAYVTGYTSSTNFPGASSSSIQPNYGGGFSNGFVAKINAAGTALLYSTYLGGSSRDQGNGIAVDSSGNAYVTGQTYSTNFPGASSSMIQPSGGGNFNSDAFVAEINAAGTTLVYSTYLGGSDYDVGNGIAVDSGGNAYVTGVTLSSDFPTTRGTFQATAPTKSDAFCGTAFVSRDAFVTKLNTGGSALAYSTYLGGDRCDEGYGIAVDSAGNAYVTGFTNSHSFPTTMNAIQSMNRGVFGNAFVTTLNPRGTAPLVFSTYLGGTISDQGSGIAVDSLGSAYVTGYASSTDFPTTMGVYQTSSGGRTDAFVAKISNITCKAEKDDVEGDGHEKGDDGRDGEFHFCKRSGEMDFEERDSNGKIVGQPMTGKMNTVTTSGNQAIITGPGTLADGTPVNYNAVVFGNQPVIGANHFAIGWVTATGSVFQTSGALTDGYIVVQPQ
jgi:beta-propeller repeat-containing protein